MPAERCPRCGTARTAGSCACGAASPVEETAVLPHLEGPPLVRPYVAGTPVVEAGDPAGDPFATRIAPPAPSPHVPPAAPVPPSAPAAPVPPVAVPTSADRPPAVQPITGPPSAPPPQPGRPPRVPQAASPFGPVQPHPDAAATQLLPPVPPQHVPPRQAPPQAAPGRFVPTPPPDQFPGQFPDQAVPPVEQTMPLPRATPYASPTAAAYPPVPAAGSTEATQLIQLDGYEDGPGDGYGDEPPGGASGTDLGMFTFREDGEAGRADRRERRRQSADRRRLVIAGGAVGVTALGATLAMLLSSSSTSGVDRALPAPTGPAVSAPAEVSPSPAETSPAAASSAPAEPSPSPTRTTARPTQAVTSKAPAVPTNQAPVAVAPSTSAAAPSPSPTPSFVPGRVLRLGDTGPEVVAMQRLLMAYNCNNIGPLDQNRTDLTNQPGFGSWTLSVLSSFQQDQKQAHNLRGFQPGTYDAPTQEALQSAAPKHNC